MNILYAAWTDLGDGNRHRAEALNRYCKNVEARCFSMNSYTEIETNEELRDAANWADLIHLSDTIPGIFGLNKADKPYVLELRGGFARMNSDKLWKWQMKSKVPIITTGDLGRYVPRFHYIPMAMDLEKYDLPDRWPINTEKPYRVVQTPTRRDYKDTDLLIDAVKNVGSDNATLTLIENKPMEEAIEAKKNADVYFGKFKAGDYGQSECEALCYGLSVACRLQPLVRFYNPGCPIFNVKSQEELEGVLMKEPREIMANKTLSRMWADSFLSYPAVASRMRDFYEYVIEGDDWYWWEEHAKIWMEVASRVHGAENFVDPRKIRW